MNFESSPNFFSSNPLPRTINPAATSFAKDATKSKAYLNAMRSLQEKIKELEKEKLAWMSEKQEIITTVENEYQEIMKQYRKEIDEYINKELEMKEKVRILEERNLENEAKIDDFGSRFLLSETDFERRAQGMAREMSELKSRLQEELQTSSDLRADMSLLEERNRVLSDEKSREIAEIKAEREDLEEKLSSLEGKYESSQLEIQELKAHYSHEINEYQDELLRIQEKFQREFEVLLQEKDQLVLENRRLFNELALKDEDIQMVKRKLETLTMEKKKDDMYKQIMTEFQMSRGDANSSVFFRNPTEPRNTFSNNISEILLRKKPDSVRKQLKSSKMSDSSAENHSEEENQAGKKAKNDRGSRKKRENAKKIEESSDSGSESGNGLEFYKEKERQHMQDFQKNFKEIVTLENEIKQTNQKYENLILESQATLDSQEKAKIRQKLFALNETLNKANEKMLALKKMQTNYKN